jgi:hypothetical protein
MIYKKQIMLSKNSSPDKQNPNRKQGKRIWVPYSEIILNLASQRQKVRFKTLNAFALEQE